MRYSLDGNRTGADTPLVTNGRGTGLATRLLQGLVAPLILRFHFCRCYLQDAARWLGRQVPPSDGVAPRFTSFYGTADEGGTSTVCHGGCGTVYSLSVGLHPFVETVPGGGQVG